MADAGGKKITLLDKYRVEWPVNLVEHGGNGRMHLGEKVSKISSTLLALSYTDFLG